MGGQDGVRGGAERSQHAHTRAAGVHGRHAARDDGAPGTDDLGAVGENVS